MNTLSDYTVIMISEGFMITIVSIISEVKGGPKGGTMRITHVVVTGRLEGSEDE